MINAAEEFIKNFPVDSLADEKFLSHIRQTKGLTGALTIQVISECLKRLNPEFGCYFEVGIYQGSTLAGVAKESPVMCYGLDNFSQAFYEDKLFPWLTTEQVVELRIKQHGLKNVKVINEDFRTFLAQNSDLDGNKVQLYFYDGPHEYQDQVDGVVLAFPMLADEALIFIDDFASENVQHTSRYLIDTYKELSFVKVLIGPYNGREYFNQGQVVLKYSRGGAI